MASVLGSTPENSFFFGPQPFPCRVQGQVHAARHKTSLPSPSYLIPRNVTGKTPSSLFVNPQLLQQTTLWGFVNLVSRLSHLDLISVSAQAVASATEGPGGWLQCQKCQVDEMAHRGMFMPLVHTRVCVSSPTFSARAVPLLLLGPAVVVCLAQDLASKDCSLTICCLN